MLWQPAQCSFVALPRLTALRWMFSPAMVMIWKEIDTARQGEAEEQATDSAVASLRTLADRTSPYWWIVNESLNVVWSCGLLSAKVSLFAMAMPPEFAEEPTPTVTACAAPAATATVPNAAVASMPIRSLRLRRPAAACASAPPSGSRLYR